MRRKDREVTDKTVINQILDEAEVVRIAMIDGQEPYIVAMNYAHMDGCLYMHCALEGRKIDIIRTNNRVAFQLDTGVSLELSGTASACTTRYMSVFGTGNAFVVEEPEGKKLALDLIMKKHTGKENYEYPEKVLDMTLALKIEIDFLTAKKN